jgi:hypothetical protein
MTVVVSLKRIVEEMDVPSDHLHAYLNKETGELVTIGDEEIEIMERGDELDDCPEWQQEAIKKTEEVLSSEAFLPLPSKFEIHEYRIMEQFCLSLQDEGLSIDLLDAIRGHGAFRRFKEMIHRTGIAEAWYQFRHRALIEIAAEWLKSQEIPFVLDDEVK